MARTAMWATLTSRPRAMKVPRGGASGTAGRPGPVEGAGSSSARMPAVTRSSASREAVERVMPVAAATPARETGSGEDRTRRATRARLAVRRVDWRAEAAPVASAAPGPCPPGAVVLLVRTTP